jgi:hypothetical protein
MAIVRLRLRTMGAEGESAMVSGTAEPAAPGRSSAWYNPAEGRYEKHGWRNWQTQRI